MVVATLSTPLGDPGANRFVVQTSAPIAAIPFGQLRLEAGKLLEKSVGVSVVGLIVLAPAIVKTWLVLLAARKTAVALLAIPERLPEAGSAPPENLCTLGMVNGIAVALVAHGALAPGFVQVTVKFQLRTPAVAVGVPERTATAVVPVCVSVIPVGSPAALHVPPV
jgi:hypothetical protein